MVMIARILSFLAFLSLAACASWPDVPVTDTAEAADWPALLPIDEIGSPPVDPDRETANDALLERAADLRARAAMLRRPVPDDDAMERLRQSLGRQ